MESLKTIYISMAGIFFIVNAICFTVSMSKKSRLSHTVAMLQLFSMLSVLFYITTLSSQNLLLINICFGLFFGCQSFNSYMLLRLIYVMETSGKKNKTERKIPWFGFVVAIDTLFLGFNYISNSYFDVQPYLEGGKHLYYLAYYNSLFIFHLAFQLFIIIAIIIHISINIYKSSRIDKGKYIAILSIAICIFICNLFYELYPFVIIYDYSVLLTQALSITTYIFSLYLLPKSIRKSMLSVANRDISDGVLCFDNTKECIYINRLAQKILGRNIKKIDWIQSLLNSDKELIKFKKQITLDDEVHYFDVEFRQILDRRKKLTGYCLKLSDMTLEVRKFQEEQYRSTHDELTGVYNRSYFFSEMERILLENVDESFYIIASNIRDFKLINDVFGTKFGDSLLKMQAEAFSHAVYENCIVGRISADKFALLIPKENFRPDLAVKNTEGLRQLSKNVNFKFTMYLGLYEINNHYENVHTMYDKANLAIKNNIQENQILSVYDTNLMKKIMNKKDIISEFKYALETNQFKMFLQPQINCKTGECLGAEALVRWFDLDNNTKKPAEFIPVLEEAGLIYKLDNCIWELAAKKIKEWQVRGFKDYYISVNISVKDFYYSDLYSIFTNLVEKYEIPASNLHLEITESVIIGDHSFHREILSRLRKYGFSVEMDDFGSGYSSLNTLKEMKMDVLKIDMGFISKTNNEERGKVIVSSIIGMAKALEMKVISEGVENEKQAEFLRESGSDFFQGYLFSEPLCVEDFEAKYMEGEK